eukprot:1862377-Prymnesium_polylepis.1
MLRQRVGMRLRKQVDGDTNKRLLAVFHPELPRFPLVLEDVHSERPDVSLHPLRRGARWGGLRMPPGAISSWGPDMRRNPCARGACPILRSRPLASAAPEQRAPFSHATLSRFRLRRAPFSRA